MNGKLEWVKQASGTRNRLDSYVTQSEPRNQKKADSYWYRSLRMCVNNVQQHVTDSCSACCYGGFACCAAYAWAKTYEYFKLLNAFHNVLDLCEGKLLLLLFAAWISVVAGKFDWISSTNIALWLVRVVTIL